MIIRHGKGGGVNYRKWDVVYLLWRCRHRSGKSSSLSSGNNRPAAENRAGESDSRGRYYNTTYNNIGGGAKVSGGWSHLGAGCSFPAALQTDKHDDVVFSFGWSPCLHTRVHELHTRAHTRTHTINFLLTELRAQNQVLSLSGLSNRLKTLKCLKTLPGLFLAWCSDLDELFEDGMLDHPSLVQTWSHLLQIYGRPAGTKTTSDLVLGPLLFRIVGLRFCFVWPAEQRNHFRSMRTFYFKVPTENNFLGSDPNAQSPTSYGVRTEKELIHNGRKTNAVLLDWVGSGSSGPWSGLWWFWLTWRSLSAVWPVWCWHQPPAEPHTPPSTWHSTPGTHRQSDRQTGCQAILV